MTPAPSRSNAGKRGPRSAEMKAKVLQLVAEGVERKHIAERLGIATGTVSQLLNGRGGAARKNSPNADGKDVAHGNKG